MKNIAIFASGSGTNAQQITEYFRKKQTANIKIILSNNPGAFVLERAKKLSVPTVIFNRDQLNDQHFILKVLKESQIDLIVLAGFLWLLPEFLIKFYPQKIINIHPALLPKYGGKGMYGMKVHECVIADGEKETGISIHFVNERYDEGNIIFQAKCSVEPDDTPDMVAAKVHKLEYEHFPTIIEKIIMKI
jgi:phosphoribosylglycinamide formyltransferase 1